MRRLWVALATTALLAASLPATALAAAPANDNVADAAVLSGLSGSIAGTTLDATDESGEPTYSSSYSRSVWYRWTPGRKALVTTFDTCAAATFDTEIEIWTGAVTPSILVVRNDDANTACPANALRSTITFRAAAGTTYWIRVAGWLGVTGTFTLTWTTSAVERGTLTVTLTNLHADPGFCALTMKGSNLLPGQTIEVVVASTSAWLISQEGRWTNWLRVAGASWNADVAGDLTLEDNLYTSDGVSTVIPRFSNHCSP